MYSLIIFHIIELLILIRNIRCYCRTQIFLVLLLYEQQQQSKKRNVSLLLQTMINTHQKNIFHQYMIQLQQLLLSNDNDHNNAYICTTTIQHIQSCTIISET